MTNARGDPTKLWYRANAKNAMLFAVIWLGEMFLILKFVKWAIHGSAALYLFMIPWALFGLIMVVRPNWAIRMKRATDEEIKRTMGRSQKWNPPGFP
jgi:hypothetical protein